MRRALLQTTKDAMVFVRVHKDELAAIRAAAKRKGASVSAWIRAVLRTALGRTRS